MVFTQKMINFITSTHTNTNTITVTNTINTITDNNSYFLLLYTSSSTNLFSCIS